MIDIVTLSCNDDPIYWEFWNPISKHWKQQFGIHPVLFYYGKDNPQLSEEYGTVFYHDIVDGVPDYVPATWGRFWVTKFFPNKMCLVSDIDMFPLSKDFFLRASNPRKDAYTHLNADAYHPGNQDAWVSSGVTVPVCYHLATSEMLKSVYGFCDSFSEEIQKLLVRDYSEYTNGFANTTESHLEKASAANGGMWGIDEMYSTSLLREWARKGNCFVGGLQIPPTKRLCRSRLGHQLSFPVRQSFVDFHSLRPYTFHESLIQAVIDNFTE